jgi:ADP-ribose pyrophosphatase YjhB (NUDIX family)
MERVKVGKYKTVFQGELFTVKQAKAVFPDGRIKTFERVFRNPSVSVLAIDNKKRLLLNHEYRVHLKKYVWRLPSGRVDDNETPKHAARRELMEETGFDSKKIVLFNKNGPAQSYAHIHYTYLATNLIPKKLDAGEYEDITTIPTPLSKAYKMIVKGEIEGKEMAFTICQLYWNRKKALS